jgi:lipopolysaccharide/colanic/teichoic acid biosynthesis glycosyltransferase
MKMSLGPPSVKAKRSREAAGHSFAKPMRILPSRVAAEKGLDAAAVPVWKRALDLACIFLALPGVLLVMGLIAAFIKTVSPGPVFFKQERVGHRRARFRCWKFRTMRNGTDTAAHQQHLKQLLQSDAPLTKMDVAGDPRLIPGGAMLRATGLDELPQLINVLRGEMSLVGPRPCLPYEEEGYRPWQYGRFDTLPGMTGLWQVSGKNKTTFTEMVTLDILYTRKKSLWLDLKIMVGTLSVVALQVREARGRRPVATMIPAH